MLFLKGKGIAMNEQKRQAIIETLIPMMRILTDHFDIDAEIRIHETTLCITIAMDDKRTDPIDNLFHERMGIMN